MVVNYSIRFVKQVSKLPVEFQDQVSKKIKIFEKDHTTTSLKTHKLKGQLKNYWAFSVSYSHRIIFEIIEGEGYFLEIGDHDLYR